MIITLLNCAYTLCVTCFAFPTFLQSKGKMCFIRDICLFEFVQKVLSCQMKLKCMSYSQVVYLLSFLLQLIFRRDLLILNELYM